MVCFFVAEIKGKWKDCCLCLCRSFVLHACPFSTDFSMTKCFLICGLRMSTYGDIYLFSENTNDTTYDSIRLVLIELSWFYVIKNK